MPDIRKNLDDIQNKIEKIKSSRSIVYPVTILAVTKTMPSSSVRETVSCGLKDIGENRVQEAEKKFAELADLKFTRHLIGNLQENKVNKAACIFDWIQSIDDAGTAHKLNRKLVELNKKIPVLIEVNTSGEESKFGILPEMCNEFTGQISELPNLEIRGLMTVGPLNGSGDEVRTAFALLKKLQVNLASAYRNLHLDTVSMGMSGDFETAIEEGSTMIRLGRILFGERNYTK